MGLMHDACVYIRFPRHPQQKMRMKCLEPLVKTVKLSSGKKQKVPVKVFCYKNFIDEIQQLLSREGALNSINKWRGRKIPVNSMADIYDGVIWKTFKDMNGQYFFSDRCSLGLLINVDWFQPYKHVSYSVGAIYLSILNFPRHLRFKQENMILFGIIPGPCEPSLHINSYLEPLVHDLLKLWKGVSMQTCEGTKLVRAALLCNSSDIPATRKVGGFVGHAALKGCSRCLKNFPTHTFGEKADYSGFSPNEWPKRNIDEHNRKAFDWKFAKTLSCRHKIEREYGVRFSELIRLPYFDSIRFSVVDPMHNVLLGTVKLMMTVWKAKGLISSPQYEEIQKIVDVFITPAYIGRIPHKIGSGFSSFTADQWKNWYLIYSQVTLKHILPRVDYECWMIFVEACHIIVLKSITLEDLAKLESLLIKFCKKFQQVYGPELCTPNLHLHCHLHECIYDFGPAHVFWLFGCERLNGILGSFPTNHAAIEMQLMRKFTSTQQVLRTFLQNTDSVIQDILGAHTIVKGSLKSQEIPEYDFSKQLSCTLLPTLKEGYLNRDCISLIDVAMKARFGEQYSKTSIIYHYSNALSFRGELIGSKGSLHASSSMVLVEKNNIKVPAVITNCLKVHVSLGNQTQEEYLVAVHWLLEHPHKHWFGNGTEVWQALTDSIATAYILVSSICCRCAHVTTTINFTVDEKVTIVIPLPN